MLNKSGDSHAPVEAALDAYMDLWPTTLAQIVKF